MRRRAIRDHRPRDFEPHPVDTATLALVVVLVALALGALIRC